MHIIQVNLNARAIRIASNLPSLPASHAPLLYNIYLLG